MFGNHAPRSTDDNLTWQLSKYTATLPISESLASGVTLVVQRSRQLLMIYGGDRILQQVYLSSPLVEIKSRDGAIAVTRNLGNASTRFRFRTLNNNDFLYILEVLSTFTNVIPVPGPSPTVTSMDSQFSQLPSQQSQLTSQDSNSDTFGGLSQNCFTPSNNNSPASEWSSTLSGSHNTSYRSSLSNDFISPFKPTFSSTQKSASQMSQKQSVLKHSQNTSILSSTSSAAKIDTQTQMDFTPPSTNCTAPKMSSVELEQHMQAALKSPNFMELTASKISKAELEQHMKAALKSPNFLALVTQMTEIMKQPGWPNPQSEQGNNAHNPKFIPPKKRSSRDLGDEFSQPSQVRKRHEK